MSAFVMYCFPALMRTFCIKTYLSPGHKTFVHPECMIFGHSQSAYTFIHLFVQMNVNKNIQASGNWHNEWTTLNSPLHILVDFVNLFFHYIIQQNRVFEMLHEIHHMDSSSELKQHDLTFWWLTNQWHRISGIASRHISLNVCI